MLCGMSPPALTISRLAAYAGVTVRTVRHYHQVGLLPEPERDASGYRRYGATAVVSLIRIRTLADAGVPLSRIAVMLSAGPDAFAAEIDRIDRRLAAEIERLLATRERIARLTHGDDAALPGEVVGYLDRLRELGVSERVLRGERDGWIIMAARWPERVVAWMPGKVAALADPRVVRLYLALSAYFDDAAAGDALLVEAADIMAELSHEAVAAGETVSPEVAQDALPFDLLDALLDEADPRARRIRDLMRERGWTSWTRTQRQHRKEAP